MMRLKLDENMPSLPAEALRKFGHDVHTASDEGLLGKPDEDVWDAVCREQRLLLTLDRDFGLFATATAGNPGAVVLRPREADRGAIVHLAQRALAVIVDIDMKNRVAIFDDERVRIRPPLSLIEPQERS